MKNFGEFINESSILLSKWEENKKELKKLIKKSKLASVFKDDIIERIDSSDEEDGYQSEIICELDICLYFLEKKNFKTWDLSHSDDKKLENYLRQYFSEKLIDFPKAIVTEDGVVLYMPGRKYKFSKDELPEKMMDTGEDLYTIHISALGDARQHGRKHFFSKCISLEDCNRIKDAFLAKDFEKLRSMEELFYDVNSYNFNKKIDTFIADIADFVLDEPIIKKATKAEKLKAMEDNMSKYNL